jgi:serine/threonine protein kinase
MESPKPTNERVVPQEPAVVSGQGQSFRADRANLRTLGRYEIQEELGRGAMGAVYKAFDPVISRTVALKTILIDNHAPDRAQMIERLKQEAKAAGGLDHPNIITVYDVGEENGAVYLSMQFVKGTTLAEVLADVGVPSLPTLLSWADQILAAVGFAHARGVIHRDLKPANLMVTEQGAIKVLDFGIAKIENTSLTQTGLVVGTPSYMSPEQIAGKKVDHRSDIFSLGAVFYELLTREKAFAGEVTTVLYKIVNEDPVAPSLINPAIPGVIDAVIRKALAKDPKDRFQTCEEMRKAFVEQSARAARTMVDSSPADKTVAIQPPTAESARRTAQIEKEPPRIWPRLILVAALVLTAVASWAFYVRSRSGTFPPLVAKIESRGKQVLASGTAKLGKFHRPDDTQSVSGPRPQNGAVADDPTTASQTALTPAAASASVVAASQPAAQSSGDQPPSESTPAPGAPALSPALESSQKPAETSQTPSSQASEPSDNNRPTGDDEPTRESGNAPVASRENDRESAAPAAAKPPARKRAPESGLTVDGFSRQDVPDLLRQAESSSARGNYRLARYEYGLVLKLDHNNAQAREGLRRLVFAWQSR